VTRYASAEQYARVMLCDWPLTADEQMRAEVALDLTATYIDMARAASGADSCTLSAGAQAALAMLNCQLAAIYYDCPCAGKFFMSDTIRQAWMTGAQGLLDAIRDGRYEVCQGETGSEHAAIGWAEVAWDDARAAEIYDNAAKRSGA
jgi:hypothetical protein